ncbi:hypothetical protein CHU92_05405 [Flavobacterium cyanobacteriorum]|uniref:GIY-YIG domain-containing protein n=1 Tax=Flavobacterium cyanobacteriorum TaxID=2022802 RepID=A0A255ZA65_9FLAO|nr:hypothetical protein [Flavobacterium cyanobacteriorum]OYQ38346.1 hypothetical protein CHU92_05405 [Flavobacterium cyanobacteriorum]
MNFNFNLNNYSTGSFTFTPQEDLFAKCNAPQDKSGVYVVYKVGGSSKEIIYIGSSGHIKPNGDIAVRSSGKGGIKGRIVYGHQFKDKRIRSWKNQMIIDNIELLEIDWFVTYCDKNRDSPLYVEINLLHEFYKNNNVLPKWNLKL